MANDIVSIDMSLFFPYFVSLSRCPIITKLNTNVMPLDDTPITGSLILYLLTYLLTPWCRALLEKLTGLQLVKKFPAFHGTRRFITALTRVRHLFLS